MTEETIKRAHEWVTLRDTGSLRCRICGVVKRRSGKMPPCAEEPAGGAA